MVSSHHSTRESILNGEKRKGESGAGKGENVWEGL